jgi:membrane protein implicated in regulation of membrane protease activity
MDFLSANIWVLWIATIIVFLIIEAATVGLTSIWFAVGGLAALAASLFGAEFWLQMVFFLVVSILALLVTKPLARKVNASYQPTNADMIIGMEGITAERIDNLAGTGAVSVGGKMWTARAEKDGEVFETGEKVYIIRIEGVKLIVTAAGKKEPAAENKEEEQ